MREERDGVDAVGQRTHVGAPRALREALGLDRVRDIADQYGDGGGGKHASVHQLGREAEHAAAQRVDEEELYEIIEGEAEEAIDVAATDPTHAQSIAFPLLASRF